MYIFRRSFCSSALKMVKVLNVAEKNDAAKSIAEVMSRGRYQRVFIMKGVLTYQSCLSIHLSIYKLQAGMQPFKTCKFKKNFRPTLKTVFKGI